MLAAAGILDGKRATTHWAHCASLARRFPQITVDPDPIFVRQGQIYTSAGVTAGMDLSLALVEEDLGRDVALLVARHLVMFLQRPGGQSQFSAPLLGQTADREPIHEAQRAVLDHPQKDHSVQAMARRAGMSARNFARVFTRKTGKTPAAYVEQVRVDLARQALEQTSLDMPSVARRVGFGSVETLRRAFTTCLGVPPSDYRQRFKTGEPS